MRKSKVDSAVHPVASRRGRALGSKVRGARRNVQRGAAAVQGALALAAGSVVAFGQAFWRAV